MEEETRRARAAAQSMIFQKLEKAQSRGELPPETNLSALSQFLAMVIQGMAVQARDGADVASLLTMAELAMQSFPKLLGICFQG